MQSAHCFLVFDVVIQHQLMQTRTSQGSQTTSNSWRNPPEPKPGKGRPFAPGPGGDEPGTGDGGDSGDSGGDSFLLLDS